MTEDSTPFMEISRNLLSWPARIALLGTVFIAEKALINAIIDSQRAQTSQGLGGFVHMAQHWGFRYLVAFLATSAVFAYVREADLENGGVDAKPLARLRTKWLVVHLLLFTALVPLSHALYQVDLQVFSFVTMVILWVLVAGAAVMAAAVGMASRANWLHAIRSLGIAWLYAAIAALLGTCIWEQSEKLWTSTAGLTFELVKLVLTPILPSLSVDAATRVIRADNFAIEISKVCSGMEGLGLMLTFSIVWLIYFRREYIFPRSLLLIPISLAAIFGLNVLRISGLLLIGNAGHPEIASFGFHSQAGWIGFNAVACALVYCSRRYRWLNRTATAAEADLRADNPAALYLMPMLAILTAGTVSHAFSGRFETLYPLRLVAAIVVLLIYRRGLLALDWRWSWRAPAVGALVFVIWYGAARMLLPASTMPDVLAAMPPAARHVWIASRLLASVLTVPLAEELAYRGYLMRRLESADFESVPYWSVGWIAMTSAAIAFGAMHGTLWLPAILAGVGYGILVKRCGRLGEAVTAHATTNALVALAVLGGNEWRLW